MALTAIPENFGTGGSGLAPKNSGSPTLRELLEEHRAAIAALQGDAEANVQARFATTGDINLATTALTAIDGVTPVAGDIALVKSQSTSAQNGLYVVSAGAWTRLKDGAGNDILEAGLLVAVSEGTANANTLWHLDTNNPIVAGTTTPITFTQMQLNATTLASTANGNGAALVGIEDAAGLFTGTNLEAAMAEKLTGLRVANLADDSVIGGVPVVHIINILDGATADKDVTLTHKTEITSVMVIKTAGAGGANDKIRVKNGATAITDDMDINVADQALVRAASIDDASNVIAAAGTLRVTKTKASGANVACKVVIQGVRRV